MSLGATVAGRRADYSPSRKSSVLPLEGGGEPARFDEIAAEHSDESRDDHRDPPHTVAKSGPSSINTCASETDEADYETSSEGPSRLVEGKSSHTRFLAKSQSGSLRKETATKNSKKLPETNEMPNSRPYTYVREDVDDDAATSSVSLPILKSIESTDIARVNGRMISDSSFARQHKLRMIVEQTEFLLSAESAAVESTTKMQEIDCHFSKEYEPTRHESMMLLPVIQDIKPTNPAKGTIKMFDREPNSSPHHRYHANSLIDIAENPESSTTSFYLPPYPVNCTRSYRTDDSISLTSTAATKARSRRISNDANVLLKIHGEFSPLRCELSEIAAKFRALKLQRMPEPFEERKKNYSILSGSNNFNALVRCAEIDRSGGGGSGGGLYAHHCLVGNSRTQFSPITMVGKSNSREISSRSSSIGNNTRLLAAAATGFQQDQHRSYHESNDPTYFQIASGHDCSIASEHLGERIANSQPSSSFERYRPRSSCMYDRYHESQQRGVVRSSDGCPYDGNFSSRKPYDTDGSRYVSRTNAEEPPDLLILTSSKEVVREEDRAPPRWDRRRSRDDLGDTPMANVYHENPSLGDRGLSSTVSLCKERRPSRLDSRVRCSDEKRSICRMESSSELVDEKTETDLPDIREAGLLLKHHQHRHRHQHRQQRHQHQQTAIVDRSSQTFERAIEYKEKSTASSTSEKRIRVISVPKNIEKVKIVPVLFTAGIPEPLFPFFRLEDPACSGNPMDGTSQRTITLKRRNSRKISSPSSGKRGPSESDTSGSYMTGSLALPRDYFSENERWRCNTNTASRVSVSCFSRSGSSKKTSSSNALKYASALGSVCSGVARVTISGSTIANQQRRRQIRETSAEKGIRGMRSSPEDFLCDT